MSFRASQSGTKRGADMFRRISDRLDKLERIIRLLRDGVPTGGIILYGNAVAPSGWVRCNGATYDGTQPLYLALWNEIGTTFGGTGQPAFDVPNIASVGSAVYIIKL